MNLTQCTIDTTIIGILATDAEQRGLTEQEFKNKFDQFGKDFVKWFNETHLPNVKEQTEAGFTAVNESLSHVNILDNPWFTINQKNQSSYSGSLIYTVDRWILASGTATISTNGVTINGTPDFFQKHELGTFIIGKTYTISAIVDNVLKSWTFEWKDAQQFSGDFGGWQFNALNNWYGFNFISINIPAKNEHTIKAIKLELGTISTLHLDAPPNPQVELAKCQRYRELISTSSCAGISNGVGGIYVRHGVPFKVTKRISNPTVIIRSYNNTAGKISYFSSGSWLDIDATVVADANGFFLEATLPVANANTAWGAWAEINAEL
ncbi:MAG: hypothetical protein AB9836_05965 [Aminipila sp.]